MLRSRLVLTALALAGPLASFGPAQTTVTLPLVGFATYDHVYGDGLTHPLGYIEVRQRILPTSDKCTFIKFNVPNLGLGTTHRVSSATLSLQHFANEANTPADYTSAFSVSTPGYFGGWAAPEAAVDNWSTTTPGTYAYGYYHETHSTTAVLGMEFPAGTFLTYSSNTSEQANLAQFVNADTNGTLTLVCQGFGTPNNYADLWRSIYFNQVQLQVTLTPIPEPGCLLLAGAAVCAGVQCYRRRRLRVRRASRL